MALETALHINDLVITNPDGLDDLSQGDNHIRMLKDVIKRDLPLTTPATSLGISLLTSANAKVARGFIGVSNNPIRNRIINGTGYSVDQRWAGSSHTITANQPLAYQYDRFYAACTGGNVTLAGKTFTGSAANTSLTIGTRIESANCGVSTGVVNTTTFTLSASILSSSVDIAWAAYSANSVNTFGTIAAPTRTLISSGTFLTSGIGLSSLYLASFTLNTGAAYGIEIVFSCGALASGQTVTINNAQFEEGQISADAHSFEIVDLSLQLSRCKYYYNRYTTNGNLSILGSGHQNSTTTSRVTLPANSMFKNPAVAFGGSVLLDIAGATTAATLSTQYNSINTVAFDVTHAAVGAAGGAVMLQLPNSTANYIELDSELYT